MALHVAVLRRDREAVDRLLKNYFLSRNYNDEAGRTPLSYAAETGQNEIVELFLARSTNPDSKCTGQDFQGRTPAVVRSQQRAQGSSQSCFSQMVWTRILVDKTGQTPLLFAASNGYKEVVELLLAKGGDFEYPYINKQGWTLLLSTARNGHKAVVETASCKGADPDYMDEEGQTALSIAAGNGHKEVVELLSRRV